MRESTFGDYVMYHDHDDAAHTDEPFMGLDPDGFFGESSLTELHGPDNEEDGWDEE